MMGVALIIWTCGWIYGATIVYEDFKRLGSTERTFTNALLYTCGAMLLSFCVSVILWPIIVITVERRNASSSR
jgi:hypothetical protein